MASPADFISVLRNSQPQTQIWHHQTKGLSSHLALGEYYDAIGEVIDELVESIEGVYPRIAGYKSTQYIDWTDVSIAMSYFKGLYDYVQSERKNFYQESWIQNMIDEVAQLIAHTLYKLSLL
jgi:hypothetical protein